MDVSPAVQSLYTDMYADGVERAWRDAGAREKSANIARVWRESGLASRPTVVEIGCGEGAIAQALSSLKFYGEYTGYDLSESGIIEAQNRSIPGATFKLSTGKRIKDLHQTRADVVIMSHVVEHLEHPRDLLLQAREIAPIVIIEVPLELNLRTPWNYTWDTLGHINKYNPTSIRHLVQTCHFVIQRQITTLPGREVAAFHDKSLKKLLTYRMKQLGLKFSPFTARLLFTYHETILARRMEGENQA